MFSVFSSKDLIKYTINILYKQVYTFLEHVCKYTTNQLSPSIILDCTPYFLVNRDRKNAFLKKRKCEQHSSKQNKFDRWNLVYGPYIKDIDLYRILDQICLHVNKITLRCNKLQLWNLTYGHYTKIVGQHIILNKTY